MTKQSTSHLDFSNMHFQIEGVKDLRKVESLKDLQHFWKLENEDVQLYFLYLYDQNSPFVRTYQDHRKRKEMVATYIGLDNPDIIQQLSTLEDEIYQDVLLELLLEQKSRLWTTIVVHEHLFSEYAEKLLKPIDSKSGSRGLSDKEVLQAVDTKDKIRNSLREISDALDADYTKFYGGDNEIKIKQFTKTHISRPEDLML